MAAMQSRKSCAKVGYALALKRPIFPAKMSNPCA